jgi:hypothetical protein
LLLSTEIIGEGVKLILIDNILINQIFRIISKVLDIQGEVKSGALLTTSLRNENKTQQWYINYDGTIVCAEEEETLAVDIYNGRHVEGTDIIAYTKSGDFNQVFTFEYK